MKLSCSYLLQDNKKSGDIVWKKKFSWDLKISHLSLILEKKTGTE